MSGSATATVLVVDDRVTNRNILTRLAQSVAEGVRVHAFARARDALAWLDANPPPDLVITDFNMPEMDGATFVSLLRARPGFEDVPIVVVTVYEEREYCYRALEAGATDFLLSPVDHVEFRARARNLLMLRRQQRRLAERVAELERLLREGGSLRAGADESWHALLDALPAAVMVTDPHARIVYANPAFAALVGRWAEQVVGSTVEAVFGEGCALRHALALEKLMETGGASLVPRRETVETPAGARTLLVGRALAHTPEGARVISLAMEAEPVAADVAGRRSHDPLTGVPGAQLLREQLAHEIARARRRGHMVAVHMLDLDRFRGVNEAFGDPFGDELLAAVVRRIADRLGESDFLARLRSDEFVVVQSPLRRVDDAADLCHRLFSAFAEPFRISGHEIHLSASVGVTVFPGDGQDVDVLLRNAELAMYRAKKGGRDSYRFFSQEMNEQARRAVALERELRQALAAEQFVVHYQPQVELASGRVVGAEALVRWNHPLRGVVSPAEFIELAEEIGLITPLTAWVLEAACRQFARWMRMGFHGRLSVNFSAVQFRQRGVELVVRRILERTGLPSSRLEIELVENAVIDHNRAALASLEELERMGVGLAIDDFGTGYSSLAYLRWLPVSRLKIDQSFVRGLPDSPGDLRIVEAIVGLAHGFGLRVVAEGVETEAQRDLLARLGCHEIQGYLIAPPLPAEEFEARFVRPAAALAAGAE